MDHQAYLDALLTLPAVYNPIVSRDGKWVAWGWIRAYPTLEVFVAPTDGSAAPMRLTDTPESTFLVAWSPDSQSLLVDEDQDGNERARFFRVALAQPLVLQPLTEANPNYYLRGGDWHPNGKWLVYGANVDLATGEEIEPTCIIRHDVETQERITLARPEKGGFNIPTLSPTGEQVLYWRKDLHPSGNQVWLVNTDGTDDREIINVGADKKATATWFPDGVRVLVVAEAETHQRLGIWTATDGLRWLLDDPTRMIEEAFVPFGSEQIVVQEIRDARLTSSLLHPDTGVETPFPRLAGTLAPVAPLPSGEWIGLYYSSTQPDDIVRFRMDATSPADLQSISQIWQRTALTPADLTPAEDFRWQSSDGLPIQGWLYRTPAPARGTIVYVHGGPTYHSSDTINPQIQFYVRAGFNVLDPNYRGSTGFGLAFREAIKRDGWGGLEQVDIRTGIEALIAQGIAEAGKVGITGTSYGGYSAWHAITHFTPDLLAAAAPICGMTDLVVDYETTRPDLRPYSEEMLGGSPTQAPARYFERSPINFVQHIKGRLLIVQGLQDPNVHPRNVADVRQRLDAVGIEYGVLPFEDEGHGIFKPRNQRRLYLELLNFFNSAFAGA